MSDALAERARALASAIRRLQPHLMWTDPERFFLERSQLASEADAIANQIAPADKRARRVEVEVKRGGARRAVTESFVVNGRRVTVQRHRNAFAISVGK